MADDDADDDDVVVAIAAGAQHKQFSATQASGKG